MSKMIWGHHWANCFSLLPVACATFAQQQEKFLSNHCWASVEILNSLGPKPNYIDREQEGVKASWKPINPIKNILLNTLYMMQSSPLFIFIGSTQEE